MKYKYKDGKSRVIQILDNDTSINERKSIPINDSDFKYDNGIKAWTSAIFVDLRNSSQMMEEEEFIEMSKILRSFISETLEILNLEKDLVRELGIRGDCVYGIYSTPKDSDELKIFDLTILINTLVYMLNSLFSEKGYRKIDIGIGFSCDYEFIVKTGRKGTGANDKVWIGDAIHIASKLSNCMSKAGRKAIGINANNLEFIIDKIKERNPNKNVDSWFSTFNYKNREYVQCGIVDVEFNNWVAGGMKDE
ncbi:adenylate cyclase [Paracholeplasma brassicae]|uniref:adenylate cyclase n=1 Tax=Acholeplasma brassicae TaxID=61635 RepID=UPI0012FEE43B|nr:adenylate cyclase [Paracholeplasma brassicae]